MLDRRTFTHVECNLPAMLQLEGMRFPSQLLDLSISGALVNTAASPEKGQPVALFFDIEVKGQPISMICSGRLVRAEQRGVGIEFENLSMATLEQLRSYVAALSSDPEAIGREFDAFLRYLHEKQKV